MTDLMLFTFPDTGDEIQAISIDGEPWMVAAPIARALGYRDAADMLRLLDPDEKGTQTVRTPGGDQRVSILSEAGLYRALATRRAGAVKDEGLRERIVSFQRWVFHVVIPGAARADIAPVEPGYIVPQSFAQALELAARQAREIEAANTALAIAEPKAEAWDVLASAEGDYSVREAAFILNRDPAIDTGQTRLFKALRDFGLIDRRDVPYANHATHVHLRATSFDHPSTGERTAATQVRVTAAGVRYLHKRMGGIRQPAFAELLREISA